MTRTPHLVTAYPNVSWEGFSVVLIGPDEEMRSAASRVLAECRGIDLNELSHYPDFMHELPQLIDGQHDVAIIDLDSNPETALATVESICAAGSTTVMVYSTQSDSELLVRCMQAGAREFLPVPFRPGIIEEALVRATVRQPRVVTRTVRSGRLMVFVGAKGGVGVTTIACNFAVALAEEREQKTLLIDLDLPLGDAALNLGIVPEFSTINALESPDRLDGALLSKLVVKHGSNLRILAAPGHFQNFTTTPESVERLVDVARREFDNVIVDAGSHFDLSSTTLCRNASTVYLVTQAGIPELRNANRLIKQIFTEGGAKLEIVLNRYQSRGGIPEKNITEALTRPVQWKVPNDHALVREMQINASPLVLDNNPLARTIRAMADSVSGKQEKSAPAKKKKRGFSLFS